jgi:DNA-binding MarR family transcriptional regulator
MQSDERQPPLLDAVLFASRVLVLLAARSLSDITDEVTLAQYRTLVVLASRGPQNLANLAEAIGVMPATATRMCDRLVAKKLIVRQPHHDDRRHIRLVLTTKGRRLVSDVTERRRSEVGAILKSMSPEDQVILANALSRFAAAVGEVPEQDWSIGWEL